MAVGLEAGCTKWFSSWKCLKNHSDHLDVRVYMCKGVLFNMKGMSSWIYYTKGHIYHLLFISFDTSFMVILPSKAVSTSKGLGTRDAIAGRLQFCQGLPIDSLESTIATSSPS